MVGCRAPARGGWRPVPAFHIDFSLAQRPMPGRREVALVALLVLALLDPLANHWTLIAAPRTIAFQWLIVVLLAAGVAISALGSGLSLRRFLRV